MIIKIVRREWLLVLLTMLVLLGCEESKQEKKSMKTTSQPPTLDWKAFEQKKVILGHQSVGNNILNGIKRLADRDGVRINIHEQRSGPAFKGINHFFIGENGDPKSKIHDFASAIDAGAAQGADIAMMKLCYVDINPTSDVRQLANHYIKSLDLLSEKYPDTSFVAVTSPLQTVQTGLKAWTKNLIGKKQSGYLENEKRSEFNTLLRERYFAEGRLFDLAKAESNDKICRAILSNREFEVLCPDFTDDGGHLNELGQDLVATAFVNFISSFNAKHVAR
ncbi:MAG: hypothetical protein RIR39_916, partial [Pseudomonadota bacterium]